MTPGPPPGPQARVTIHLLGWLAGIAAWTAWGGMVAEPRDFLVPTALGGLAMAVAGLVLARLRSPSLVVVLVQLLVALLALNLVVAREQSLLGVVPTRDSVERVVDLVVLGGQAMGYYLAPVEAFPTGTRATLAAGGLALLWTITALAQGLGRPALVALPLLVAVSVPITVLDEAVTVPAFCVAGSAYLLLLMTDRHERWQGAAWSGRDAGGDPSPRPVPRTSAAWQVAAVSVVAALVLAPVVPLDELRGRGDGTGQGGSGSGSTVRLTTVNPFVTLQRDLLEQTDTPMVYARTDASDPAYLRTTVLDTFDEEGWSASQRVLPPGNTADGRFPAPPGLAAGAPRLDSRWELMLDPGFATNWLPLPATVSELAVAGSWRYDERYLDVALTTGSAPPGMRYGAVATTPAISAAQLDRALRPPNSVQERFTELPEDLPTAVVERAREVTAGAESDYRRAVALQDWFRESGGFRYSLAARPGSGLDLLADFVTDDRVGYCEQFAAAMAAMGRTLDIPSRVAVGFLRPDRLPDGRLLYTSDARHAWVEMFFAGVGWVRFEPTPAQVTGASPAYTREGVEDPGATPSPTPAPTEQERRAGDRLELDDPTGGSRGVSGPMAAGLVTGLGLLVLALVAPTVLRRAQRRRRLAPTRPDELAEGVWSELHASAVDVGVAWDARRSPRQQAESLLADVVPVDHAQREPAQASLEQLLQRVERGRYAPRPAAGGVAVLERTKTETASRTALLATWEQWRALLAEHVDRRPVSTLRRLRRGVLPASLLRRTPGG